ncbi:CoA transferase [uncultured Albimonas sp.]|uniref:CaiB/BaiF CoA transferase family protein n=1 Tax=uncultured Albimonas sp. TaxID=1331701 RepID=UPI0030ECFEFE|tara:strand:- start:639 stop:1760 length:1122 start_codon:yes stop_codon:yes gene_type:complete
MSDPLPLRGRLVLDLSQGIAGPACGMAMAEMGARVIKVEPPSGDWIRNLGAAAAPGASGFSLYYNRGKESLTLDLKSKGGLEAALKLAAQADLLIESGRPGVTAKMGLGFEAVKALNPGIVYLTISGFGLEGPRAHEPMVDTYAQAFTGMMAMTRDDRGAPVRFGQPLIDALTGLYATQAALAALFPTEGPRQARRLDVSLVQSAAALMGPKLLEWEITGGRVQSINPPAGIYMASDRHLALTLVREVEWAGICRALDREAWIEDPRYASFALRNANWDELRAQLEAIFASDTAEAWSDRLTAQGVLARPVNDFADWLTDPQVLAANAAPVMDLGAVSLPTPRTPSRQPFAAPAPGAGQHTAALSDEFGLVLD